MDEQELLAHYRQTNNLNVLGKLYAPYMSLLYGVCYKYLQHQEQSEDAVMQIFEELTEKLKHHQVDNFKSWLYVYTRNFCLMILRKNKRVNLVDIEQHQNNSEQALEDAQEKEIWSEEYFDVLSECLKSLKHEQESSVRMFYLEKKCYKEISDEKKLEINKVKSHIQNGKRNLKICMESKLNGK